MLYLSKQDHQAIPICLKLEIYHLLTKTSFYAIAGHYVLHSKTDVELRCTHIYMCMHTCLLPPIITCTPLLCLEQPQLASDLWKEMAYMKLFTSPASSELLAHCVLCLSAFSIVQLYSVLLSPMLGPSCQLLS